MVLIWKLILSTQTSRVERVWLYFGSRDCRTTWWATLCPFVNLLTYLLLWEPKVQKWIAGGDGEECELWIWQLVRVCGGFPSGSDGKEAICNAGDLGLIPGMGRSWRRAWQPTPVLLLENSYGERSLVGYSPWCRKDSDMTEWLSTA